MELLATGQTKVNVIIKGIGKMCGRKVLGLFEDGPLAAHQVYSGLLSPFTGMDTQLLLLGAGNRQLSQG